MRLTHLMLGTALAGIIAPALAQDEEFAIEEVIVTAQKRSESLQKVPMAIAAISGDTLKNMAISNVQDVYVQTPGMAFSQAAGEAQIYMRGIGTDVLGVAADSSVAVHQDGVYLGRPQMALNAFLDVERVEILKGPQGTLYGRNATGGAVNVISKMPKNELEGYVSLSYGSHERVDGQAAVSGPITENLRGRVAVRRVKDSGYTRNLDPNGSKVDNADLLAARGILLYEEGILKATMIGEYTKSDSGNNAVKPLDNLSWAVAPNAGATVAPAKPQPGFHTIYNDLDTYNNFRTGGVTLTVEAEASEHIAVTSISAWRSFRNNFLFNTDGTEVDLTRTYYQYETEQFSEELRISSQNTDRFSWVVGGYFLKEDKYGALGLGRNLSTAGGIKQSFYYLNDDTGKAYALFGQASYAVVDQLKLTVGLRQSKENKTDITSRLIRSVDNLGFQSPGIETLLPTAPVLRNARASWKATSPYFGLESQITPEVMLYANAVKGFKSGGWNATDNGNVSNFDPENIWAYQAGLKSDLMDGRLRLNANLFYYDYKDLQVSTFLNGLTVVDNAANAKIKGVELEMVAKPVAALTLRGNLAYTDATYRDFIAPFGRCPAVPTPAELAQCNGAAAGAVRIFDRSGNDMKNAPKWKVNMSANYDIDLGDSGKVSLFGQLSHQSRIWFSPTNELPLSQKAITLLDARIAWTSGGGQYEIAAFGKNLTGVDYFANKVRFTTLSNAADRFSVGSGIGYPAAGRTLGLQATARF